MAAEESPAPATIGFWGRPTVHMVACLNGSEPVKTQPTIWSCLFSATVLPTPPSGVIVPSCHRKQVPPRSDAANRIAPTIWARSFILSRPLNPILLGCGFPRSLIVPSCQRKTRGTPVVEPATPAICPGHRTVLP